MVGNITVRTLMAAAAIFCPFIIYGQESGDTIKVIENAKDVTISRSGGKTILKVLADDSISGTSYYEYRIEVDKNASGESVRDFSDSWGLSIPIFPKRRTNRIDVKKKRRVQSDITGLEHFYWGWRFNYGDKQNVKNGFELGVRDLVGIRWDRGRRTPGFKIGLGFGMMRMLAADGMVYEKFGDAVDITYIEGGHGSDFSRLDVWRFHVPVLLSVPFGKKGNFSIGGVLNFNTYAKAVTQVSDNGQKLKSTYKGLQQRLVTPDVFVSLSGCGMGLYFTWSPVALFDKSFGPELKAWSIGLDLLTF